MIKIDNKVKNIFHMLCFTFNSKFLKEKDQEKLGTEAFENIYNLFSTLLYLLLKRQIKKGIYQDYVNITGELSTIRGRINIKETILTNSLIRKKVICDYDEYSKNCLPNQIIKTTITYLLKSPEITEEPKDILKKIDKYFCQIDIVDVKSIKWEKIKFNKNNSSYRYLLDLCYLILNGLIVTDRKGKNHFREFLDNKSLCKIYENFLKAYFKKYYKEFNARSKPLKFTENKIDYLGGMKTDITLEYNNNILIIDAKFYGKILSDNQFKTKKIIDNANIFQMLAYVDNQEKEALGNVYGMLLYAQTLNEPVIDIRKKISGHNIIINTLDMNNDWVNIEKSLKTIGDNFKLDNISIDN